MRPVSCIKPNQTLRDSSKYSKEYVEYMLKTEESFSVFLIAANKNYFKHVIADLFKRYKGKKCELTLD